MFYTNANHLPNKVSELSVLAIMKKFKIMFVTESHFTDEIADAEISIPNFVVHREDRCDNIKGGGSAIYTHNSLSVEKLDWFKGSESLAIKVNLENIILHIVCLYRSTSLTTLEQNEKLLSQITNLPTSPDINLIVVGDLNLPDVDWDLGIVRKPVNSTDRRYILQSEYLNLFIAKGLKWHILNDVTRIRKVNDTIQRSTLDQVLSNNESLINSVEFAAPLGKSDHKSMLIELNVKHNLEYLSSKKKNWYKVDKVFVETAGNNVDWRFSDSNLSVESMWGEIYDKMQSISDQVPDMILKTNAAGEVLQKLPWDSSKLVRKRKEKDQTWNAFDITPNMVNFNTALQKQEEYQKCEFDAKVKYERKIVSQLKTNSKPFYNYLKSKSKIKRTVSSLKDSTGNLTKSPQETADTLADFFQSVFTEEQYGPLTEDGYISRKHINGIMQELTILPADVSKLLLELDINKAMGPDKVHPKLLKFLAGNTDFVAALTSLFNACITNEEIPVIWKTATVVPLHKKGSVHLANNYRPVSLTCILCKIYEKFLRKHMLSYVATLISDKQHGFTTGRSCLSNLLETIDNVFEYLSDGNCADILYFDFSKAFDSVSHHRLLIKLEAMGIDHKFVNIIRNFLGDRTMRVVVGDAVSDEKAVLSGVPQGSVIGPLLFLLFINDLPETIKNLIKIFADDVKMVVNPTNLPDIESDLGELCMWESKWLLKFNLDKCFVLHVGNANPRNAYSFHGSELKSTLKEKDLGVLFNDKFDFSDAIESFVSKAKSVLFWVTRNIISREPEVMLKAYKSIIRPHLEYCCQAWSPNARHGNWKIIMEIESVQRTFTRLVQGLDSLTYQERLKKLGLTTLLERRMRGDLIETFKILNQMNNYGSHFFNLSTRTNNLVARPGGNKNMDFFGQRVIRFWNKLPEYVKDKKSVNGFKNALDDFRKKGIINNIRGQFWELSDDIFNRIYS